MYSDKILVVTNKICTDKLEDNNIKGTNKPFNRHCKILEYISLYNNKYILIYTDENEDVLLNQIKNIEKYGIDADYIKFLMNAYNAWKNDGFDCDYISPIYQGLIPYHFCVNKTIDKNNIKSLPYWKQCGFYCSDFLTPIYNHTFETALKCAINSINSIDYIKSNDIIYVLNIYPGHHATESSYGGYCYFNNVSLCAKKLKEIGYNNISILDLDYHHGDGTQNIFYEDENVLTISLHADPRFEYPTFNGFENERGIDQGVGKNLNIPLGYISGAWKKVNLQTYLEKMNDVLLQINSHNTEVIIIPFGADTLDNDPDASEIAGFKLKLDDYLEIGKFIKEKSNCKKIIITQEGGYDIDNVPKVVHNFLIGLTN